jgi:hypothetical protein
MDIVTPTLLLAAAGYSLVYLLLGGGLGWSDSDLHRRQDVGEIISKERMLFENNSTSYIGTTGYETDDDFDVGAGHCVAWIPWMCREIDDEIGDAGVHSQRPNHRYYRERRQKVR